ncbi:LysR family transcriptional regulator [Brevibacillus dissolubilis]|uniref:LysR family transcriptional regulator n=1 Tax=Brevibacillus dissolubilis TaxID=1844116 RepID=UPI0011169435|nr:LysR family transcriptional regulator [Brevibacillus dissolubilis]
MDTRYLHTLREVAKWQSFTKAAEELGYAQSSVTTQIQNVEEWFGAPLFERWGRKVRLTQAGELVLRYAEQVLMLLDEAKLSVNEEAQQAGTLTIGTVESLAAFYLPPFLQKYRRELPKMKLLLHPGICSDLRQGVRDGTYDIAVILDWPQTHPDIECMDLGEEEMVVVAAPDHRLTQLAVVCAEDFAGETLIVTEQGCSYRKMMEGVLREAGIVPETSLEFGSLEAIKQCAAYGLGIALLPKIVVKEEVQSGKLSIVNFSHQDIRVCKQLLYHKKKWMPQAFRRLIELLREAKVETGNN